MIRIAIFLAAISACAAPAPHYHFVMRVASLAPAPRPGEPRVAVLGQITRPGMIRFRPGLTVVGAIMDAGGLTPLGRLNRVEIDRGHTRIAVSLEAIVEGRAPDLVLAAGDVVFVPESDI